MARRSLVVFVLVGLFFAHTVHAQTPQQIQDALTHLNAAVADLQPATVSSTGQTTTLGATDDLQAALNAASCGDTILLPTAGTYTGSFTMAKACTTPITVMATFPTPIGQALVGYSLPKLRPAPGVSKTVDMSGNGYVVRGLDILGTLYDAVTVTGSNNSIDGNWIHGTAGANNRRGIALNGINDAATRNAITDMHSVGSDSQGVAGWNGPGPYLIDANYIEAASEGILFGGADPSVPGLVPSSIVVSNNYVTRPLSWRNVGYNVKNCFELKNAAHVTFTHNTCENVWHDPDGQEGYPLVLTVRNQDGNCPWCIVSDVQVTENVFRHSGSFVNILGVDDTHPSAEAANLVIRGNLVYDVDPMKWGNGADWAAGRVLQVVNGVNGLTYDHNTVVGANLNSLIAFVNGSKPLTGFTYTANVGPEGSYGVIGQGDRLGIGTPMLDFYAPGYTWNGNTVIVGGGNGGYGYPAGTVVSAGQTVVNPDFSLASGFTGGANIAALKVSIAGLDLTK